MKENPYKNERDREIKVFCLKGLHFFLTIVLFSVFWLLNEKYSQTQTSDDFLRRGITVHVLYAILFYFFVRTYNAYLLGYTRIRNLALSEFLSQFFSLTILCLFSLIIWERTLGILFFVAIIILQGILDAVWSYLCNGYYFLLYPIKKAILIYRDNEDKAKFDSLLGKPSERLYRIEKELCYKGNSFSAIKSELKGFETVFVAGIDSRCRNGIAKYCMEKNLTGYFVPHTGDVIMQGALHIQSFDSPILYLSRKHLDPGYKYGKRFFDLTFSFVSLLILSPIMIIIAVVIRIADGGPAIYKQERLTINGNVFNILKFRSMHVGAENESGPQLSTGDEDKRVTPVGRILRRFRLDELPQLVNILKGDMSFVGPRPERPEIAEIYYKTLPGFALRLQVKAGLTGYAQVYGRYNTTPYDKLQFDLLYINKMRFLTDVKLIFATFSTFFSSDSTKSSAEALHTKSTAMPNATEMTKNENTEQLTHEESGRTD